MKLGLTFNLRGDRAHGGSEAAKSVEPLASPESQDLSGYLASLDDAEEEFDSPETIGAIAQTLRELGHEVELLGDGEMMLRRLFTESRPDLVVNIAEGTGFGRAREARVPAVLEMLGIGYTGSDPLTLAVALDKDCAKRLIAAAGLTTPAWALFSGDMSSLYRAAAELVYPLIVKPAYEGSSKGVLVTSIIQTPAQLEHAVARMHEFYEQPILVEEYIEGDELTVGLVGNGPPSVLGIMRVLPNASSGPFIYSLEVKRDWQRQVRYECPAKLASRDAQAVEEAALRAWKCLGCRDVARIDFRLRQGVPYFLEANPLPGLSPKHGDLVLLAGYMGIGYQELLARILTAACDRLKLSMASPVEA